MKIEQYETVRLPDYMSSDSLEDGKIYVIYQTALAEHSGPSVQYLCPCGCKQHVFLPCRDAGNPRSREPQWELDLTTDGKVNISPSILEKAGCKSHYFIKAGEVQWI